MATEENTTERWLPVVGWEGLYEVSSLGRVRSATSGRVLSQEVRTDGYMSVRLFRDGACCRRRPQRMVLSAFDRPPLSGEEANHVDFDITNNALKNLEWLSKPQNIEYSRMAGRHAHGQANGNAKLSEDDVQSVRAMSKNGDTQRAIAARFGVTQSAIWLIVHRVNWRRTA